jgi:hypothetical protein
MLSSSLARYKIECGIFTVGFPFILFVSFGAWRAHCAVAAANADHSKEIAPLELIEALRA